MRIQIQNPDNRTRAIFKAAYPDYKGRKFRANVVSGTIDTRSYWDGGSRDYFTFVDLVTGRNLGSVPAQSAFDKPIHKSGEVELPENIACVERSIFCGKEAGLTLHLHPNNAPLFLTHELSA